MPICSALITGTERACPGVSLDLIRRVLKEKRKSDRNLWVGNVSLTQAKACGYTPFRLPMSIDIDSMTPDDWQQVRAIYLEGIASGQATFEIDAPTWEQWDAGHHPFARLVARSNGRVVGWAALSSVSSRPCYAGVAEVSVYVAVEHRGRGIGRELLLAVIRESEQHGIWTLQGATFADNEASLRLQRSCGFRQIGRRERIAQHQGVWRDTILTERRSRLVGKGDGAA
jgi:L-amino acid N-acyltransferase YncA